MISDQWVKSTRSGSQGACVEVRDQRITVGVRDSKDVSGPALTFNPTAWTAFTGAIKDDKITR